MSDTIVFRITHNFEEKVDRYQENRELFSDLFGRGRDCLTEILELPAVIKLTSKFNSKALSEPESIKSNPSEHIKRELGNVLTNLTQAWIGKIDEDDLEYDLELSYIEITEIFIQANIDRKYGQYSDYDEANLAEEHQTLVKDALNAIGTYVRSEVPSQMRQIP